MRDDRDEQIARIEEGLQKLDALIERRIAEIQRRNGDSPLSNVEDYLDDAEIVELDETRKAVRERVDALKKSLLAQLHSINGPKVPILGTYRMYCIERCCKTVLI